MGAAAAQIGIHMGAKFLFAGSGIFSSSAAARMIMPATQ